MKKLVLIASTATLLPATAMAELTVDAYGSIRVQAESVSVDKVTNAGDDKSYTGFRDAYSRFGVKASYPLSNGTTLGAKLEIPFNTAEMKMNDPTGFAAYYKDPNSLDNNYPRIYKLTASGDWGSLAIGKQWLTYYNYVSYPVDYFSSFYSGWSTYAYFRREAVTYTSPSFSGLSFAASAVDVSDSKDSNYLDTMQYALSYTNEGLTLSAAYEDQDENIGGTETLGLSASYTTGPWRFATKFEQANSDISIYNLYGSYNLGKYTFKAHVSEGDEDGYAAGTTIHLGTDYQYTKNLKVFVEYIAEENSYAVLPDLDIADYLNAGYYSYGENSQAIAVGARYDF
ncbi:porin [Thiomicrorhabdus sp. Milos-T2]|uniref:porin n=1 Tax=Thiomicrorhabdus sp. Milos-T2 TaxID=90814 RepID=UPI000494743A|nr:porin [Thiomicrorhabdus sp. Milos-T2]